MKQTLGMRIAEKRKEKGLRQDDVAERLGVSSQAVSKWENDLSCPDISALPDLAELLGTTVDELLTGKKAEQAAVYVEEKDRKRFDELMLFIRVNSSDGDKVKVNIPMPLIRACIDMGVSIDTVSGGKTKGVNIDWAQIMTLIESGVIGRLVEVESSDGDTVIIEVE
ncbi:MAG: helix-turn-helix transcriptional regulator [Clostridia bacterium]|nr:helix-turn-helix transcriptional regulator [Clostridia bacterium]